MKSVLFTSSANLRFFAAACESAHPAALVASILLLFFFSNPAVATVINVPTDQPAIQAAINAALDGDTVLVAPGRYQENINFSGKNITVASHYLLDGDPNFTETTVIDGNSPSNPRVASCVLIVSGEDANAVLQGFTITNGTGTVWRDIHNGRWYREGGGILVELSSPTIKNNLIINNEAVDKTGVSTAGGGAIRVGDGNPQILFNVIMSNRGLYGPGIVLNYTGAIIRNNLICANTGGREYGGSGIWVYNYGSAPKIIENNTIVANRSLGPGGRGGAMLIWSATVTVRNNIIWANIQSRGGPIALTDGGRANITYSDIEGGWSSGRGLSGTAGNINIDPVFVEAGHWDDNGTPADTSDDFWVEGDYHLQWNSPCIAAGDPAYTPDPNEKDIDGEPRVIGTRIDMGMDEVGQKQADFTRDVITNSIGMKLVYIPAGEFMMGSPSSEEDRGDDEGPQHRVKISKGFYMGVYEVTQQQYEAIMGRNPSCFKGGNLPVEQVSWDDATEFCRKLSQQEGKTYRLPTEAQWEYACRAGTTTPFCFGETISTDQANYNGDYGYGNRRKGVNRGKTIAVGSFQPNKFGLYDMHGNVWEGCQDWYDENYYRNSPDVDPQGPDIGPSHVLRGGSWFNYPRYCRSANRVWYSPDYRTDINGFRVVVLDFQPFELLSLHTLSERSSSSD